jgi:multidrug resistance efflux pump
MEQVQNKFTSFRSIYRIDRPSKIKYWFWGTLLFVIGAAFLPWTQNIRAKGVVTSLNQEQRPQKVNSPIPGRIKRWNVREGNFVKKGDTLAELSEIKEDYLDPNLIGRTKEQVNAKKGSIDFYKRKITTSGSQIQLLKNASALKLKQIDNKILQLGNKLEADRADLKAIINEVAALKDQYNRQVKMFEDGLVSQTQLQQRNVSYQNALAKKAIVENKLLVTQQEIGNANIEKNSVQQEYFEKINKAESDQLQSMSNIATTEGEVAKLENQVSNYTIRNGMYFITAPQDGQIVQATKSGIGEILKDGESITMIVPVRNNYAVEMFVRPVDLPLIDIGQKVNIMFDGFPAIVFSGWPNNSYGTFQGKVVAFENTINENGLFRVLVAEDSTRKKWPTQLKIGSGAQNIALLKNVRIWYEFWRNINGFPPDYYKTKQPEKGKK